MKRTIASLVLCVFTLSMLHAQTEENLRLVDWQPKSQMIVKETYVVKPKFPAIDIHVHLGDMTMTQQYIEAMDKAGVWMCINLSQFTASDDAYKQALAAANAVA